MGAPKGLFRALLLGAALCGPAPAGAAVITFTDLDTGESLGNSFWLPFQDTPTAPIGLYGFSTNAAERTLFFDVFVDPASGGFVPAMELTFPIPVADAFTLVGTDRVSFAGGSVAIEQVGPRRLRPGLQPGRIVFDPLGPTPGGVSVRVTGGALPDARLRLGIEWAIPEPSAALLFGLGALGVAARARRPVRPGA